MTTLNIILTSILVLCSIVLIAAVLMQQTKSSGLGGAFAGDTQSFTARGQAASREANHRCRRHYHRRTGDFDHDLGISGTLDFAREYAAGILPFLLEQKRGNL